MKLKIFQSEHGDCLLLESADGHLILCDGGAATSMRDFVRDELAKLRKSNRKIDFVYVSHIDSDHIEGVLQLLQDELEWRVHDHHQKQGNSVKKPGMPRPPEIGGLWHNAFRDQVGDDVEAVSELLATGAPALLATGIPEFRQAGEELYSIATSIREAIKVSRLASPEMLGIPVNMIPGVNKPATLLKVRPNANAFKVGTMRVTIVGPTSKQLNDLKKGWETWLLDNRKVVKDIDDELNRQRRRFASGIDSGAVDLRGWNGIPDFKGVTAPNVASLILMVEESGKRLLLTGDAQHEHILEGLEATKFIADGAMHLDVLKIQHHGSEHNLNWEFASIVSADHYVFCGNGGSGNPEPSVVRDVVESRIGTMKKKRAKSPKADQRPFKFWFSTAASVGTGPQKSQDRMKEVEQLVRDLAKSSNGQMTFHFNTKPFATLPI